MVYRITDTAALLGTETLTAIVLVIVLAGAIFIFGILRRLWIHLRQWRNFLPIQLLKSLRWGRDAGPLELLGNEPKSLSGMERVFGPQIRADFPELNLEELKRRAELLALATLRALDAEDISLLGEPGDLYCGQVRQQLAALRDLGQHEHFVHAAIRRSVLSDYRKDAGTCRISFQMAIGADYQKTAADGQSIAGHDGTTQMRFGIEALYIQDREILDDQALAALAINCPNCGAPVPSLGDRECRFCGSAIEPVNNKAWSFCSYTIQF